MKTLPALLILIGSFNYLMSQDIIFESNGNEITAKVTEVGIENIKFKKFENLNGPVYSIAKKDVFIIKYENGSKDVFANKTIPTPEPTSTPAPDKRNKTYPANPELNKYLVHHKSKHVIYDYQFDIDKVLAASTVYYYGLDFSNFVLENPAKLGQEAQLENMLVPGMPGLKKKFHHRNI